MSSVSGEDHRDLLQLLTDCRRATMGHARKLEAGSKDVMVVNAMPGMSTT